MNRTETVLRMFAGYTQMTPVRSVMPAELSLSDYHDVKIVQRVWFVAVMVCALVTAAVMTMRMEIAMMIGCGVFAVLSTAPTVLLLWFTWHDSKALMRARRQEREVRDPVDQ